VAHSKLAGVALVFLGIFLLAGFFIPSIALTSLTYQPLGGTCSINGQTVTPTSSIVLTSPTFTYQCTNTGTGNSIGLASLYIWISGPGIQPNVQNCNVATTSTNIQCLVSGATIAAGESAPSPAGSFTLPSTGTYTITADFVANGQVVPVMNAIGTFSTTTTGIQSGSFSQTFNGNPIFLVLGAVFIALGCVLIWRKPR
jgi:hypothetical protein